MQTAIRVVVDNVDTITRDRILSMLRLMWPGFYSSGNLGFTAGVRRAFYGQGNLAPDELDALRITILSTFPEAIIENTPTGTHDVFHPSIFDGSPTAMSDRQWSLLRLLLIAWDSGGCDTEVEWRLNRGEIELRVDCEEEEGYQLSLPLTAEMLEVAAGAERIAQQPDGIVGDPWTVEFAKQNPERGVAHAVFRALREQVDTLASSPAPRWNPAAQTRWYFFEASRM